MAKLHTRIKTNNPQLHYSLCTTKGKRSKHLLSKSFTVVIRPLSTRHIKPNFHVSLSQRRSTTVSLDTRNLRLLRTTGNASVMQGPFLKNPKNKTFGPEKPFIKLRPAYSGKLVVSYVVKGTKSKITARFCGSRHLRFEDTKSLVSP